MYTDLNIDIDAVNDIKDQKIFKSYKYLEDAVYMIEHIENNDTIKNKLKININFILDNLKSLYDDISKDLGSINSIEVENNKILNNTSQWLSTINLSLNNLNKININKIRNNLNFSLNNLSNINHMGSLSNINSIANINNIGNIDTFNNISTLNADSIKNIELQLNALNISSFSSALNSDISNLNLDTNIQNIDHFESLSVLAIASLGNLNSMNINGTLSVPNSISNYNVNVNSFEQLEKLTTSAWNQNNINSINYIGSLYQNGDINREQFNSCILVNSLSENNWLKLSQESTNLSADELGLMGQMRGLSAEKIENSKLLTSLFNENNQSTFNSIQLKMGEQLLGLNTSDSSFVSSLLASGAFSGFNMSSNGFNLVNIGLNSSFNDNPYNSVILATLLGIYISAYAILLFQDAKEKSNEKKKINKSNNKKGGNRK